MIRGRIALTRPAMLWLACLLPMALPACDRLEVTRQTPAAKTAATEADVTPKPAAAVQAGMESIGPEGAQRVYYQFVDDRGQVRFVERLSDVPPAWREQVGFVEMSQPPPLTPEDARKSWRISADRATAIKLAAASPNATGAGTGYGTQEPGVLLYSATWCGYCTKARRHLDRAGIQYEVRDVDHEANSRELREKTGRGGIPVLDFSGEILRGYSADQYDRAIRSIRG